MSKIKSILLLLAIVCAYGVAGRMEYDDAVTLESARKRSDHSGRPKEAASTMRQFEPVSLDYYDGPQRR